MKANYFSVSYVLILILSLIKCFSDTLPFIKGKYIYWLLLLTIMTFVFVIKNKSSNIKITVFDSILLLLVAMGIINFILLSKTTVYSISIWYYTGYFTLYLLLRNFQNTPEASKKAVRILLYFCTITALINVFWGFLQYYHWISSSNEFFSTTGMFYSPNQLGIYLSIGCLSSLFLLEKAKNLGLKIGLILSLLLIFTGICISESRGAFISLCVAVVYYFYHSRAKMQERFNWKIYLGIGVLLISSFYFISIISKSKTDSTSGRYFTIQQVIKQITENPLGYGVDSFSIEYNKTKADYFETNFNWEEAKNAGYIYNANNDFLEITFELGILWIAVFIVFIILLFKKKETSIETQICRTLLLCLLIFSLTNNILTLPVFGIIACICTVIIINTIDAKMIYEFKNRGIYKFMGITIVLFFAFIQVSRINAENRLYKLYQDKSYLKGINQLQEYLLKIDNKGEELFMGGLILVKNGYKKEGIQCMLTGFERSGKPSLGRILAKGLQKQKKFSQSEAIYTYNKNVEPYRYEARMDLLHLFIETNQHKKAKAMALEIINLPVKLHSEKIIKDKKEANQYLKAFNKNQIIKQSINSSKKS